MVDPILESAARGLSNGQFPLKPLLLKEELLFLTKHSFLLFNSIIPQLDCLQKIHLQVVVFLLEFLDNFQNARCNLL